MLLPPTRATGSGDSGRGRDQPTPPAPPTPPVQELSSLFKIQVLAVVASSGFLASLAADNPNAWLYSGCVFTLFFLALYPMPPLSLPSTPPLEWLRSCWGNLSQTQRSNTKFLAGFFGTCFIVAAKENSTGSWTTFAFILFVFFLGFVMEPMR